MKLIIVIMTAFLMQLSASTFGQQLSIRGDHITLREIFTQVRKQTGYTVLYNSKDLNGSGAMSLDLKAVPLQEAMTQILKGQKLTYLIEEKSIVIKAKEEPSFLEKIIARFRAIDVRGKVVDESGSPLPGATVKVKGIKQMATTNGEGEFALVGVDEDAVLIISYIGYQTKEVVAKSDLANITLVLITNDLQEVTVNKGYYTTTQKLNTGNVTTIKAVDIEKAPVGNVLAALAGRVPGMHITQNVGVPGGSFTVQIRGQNSLENGNDPLYIIDGVPFTATLFNSSVNSVFNGGNPLNFLNNSDIESVDVLKDADATAIYGSRAANGAILITTKKGKTGTTKFDFNVNSGIGKAGNYLDFMNTQQYLQMRRMAFANDKVVPTKTNAPDLLAWDTTRYTNWQKVLFGGTAHYTDAQGNASGGTTNTQYLLGIGYHRETTVFPSLLEDDGADRKVSAHLNINTATNNQKLKLNFSASYTADKNTVNPSDFGRQALFLPPDAPQIYNPDGTFNWAPLTSEARGTWSNPMASLLNNYLGQTNNLVANSVVSYNIINDLEFKTNFGYTNLQTNELGLTPLAGMDPGSNPTTGFAGTGNSTINSWIIEPQLNFKKYIGKGSFSALLGVSFQENRRSGTAGYAEGFSDDALLADIQNATVFTSSAFTSTQYKYNSIFSRLNYNWEDKYLINLTGRRDGSSRFGPANKFANFGAIGAGWIFSNEKLIHDNLPFLSFGKIRGSYGTTGNDQIDDYRYLDLFTSTSNPYQGINGLYPERLFNPYLQWEVNKKLEGGIELGFLKDKIFLSASVFRNRSGNQLISAPLASITGFDNIPTNFPAVVQNTGWEFLLNTSNVKSGKFSWSSSINLTIHRNTLAAYPGYSAIPYAGYAIGKPVNIVYVYEGAGVNATTGLYQFLDGNGNLTTTPARPETTHLIDINPKFYGGMQNSLQYAGLQLDFLFQFEKKVVKKYRFGQLPGRMFNQPVEALNNWRNVGDISDFQRFSQASGNVNGTNPNRAFQNYGNSTVGYVDGSFIKLKNVSLSYVFPVAWVQKLHIQNLRVYVHGQNLFTITKYDGFDPDSPGDALPALRVITTGFQLTL